MSNDHLILFIDTNAFLQLRDLKDISWREKFPGIKSVDLMVAPRVIDELDDHKTSTNERRRTRARLALKLIDEAAQAEGLALTIRTGPPVETRIVIYSGGKFEWSAYPYLDPAKPDDQLIAAALTFGNGAAVFSHDSGPRIRAHIAKIRGLEPLENWLLPPEKTDDQKKISQLERDLERAMSTKPNIVADYEGIDEATRELKLYVPVLKRLDPSHVEALSDAYFAMHPIKKLKSAQNQMLQLVDGYSQSAIARYEERYRDFKASVRQYFAELHEKVSAQGCVVSVPYFVQNDSGTSATGLRIEFTLYGEGRILADRKDAKYIIGAIEPPDAPEPPKRSLDLGALAADYLPRKDSDPVKFRWHDRPDFSSTTSAMQCDDFRATRKYRDDVLVLVTNDFPFSTSIKLHVSAQHSPAPINATATLIIEKKDVDWLDDLVLNLLPEEIASGVKELFG